MKLLMNSRRTRRALWSVLCAVFLALPMGCEESASTQEQTEDAAPGLAADAYMGTADVDDGEPDQTTQQPPSDAQEAKLGAPYPVVLAHGMAGFEHLAGVDSIPYFMGVVEVLENQGEIVLAKAVDPLNNSDVRGAQLLEHIEAFLAETGHEKVIIIGHSQGGLDARWVAHHRPDLVAAVVGYATPNHGTPIADIALGFTDNEFLEDAVNALLKIFGAPLYGDELGDESSLFEPINLFTTPGITDFNSRITDAPSVAYYSVTGRTDLHSGGQDCWGPDLPKFVTKWQYTYDTTDPILALSEVLIDGGIGDPFPNDGLVRVRDAKWGRFLGCVPADHMDQIGQLLGDDNGSEFDHVRFFVELIDFLHREGH